MLTVAKRLILVQKISIYQLKTIYIIYLQSITGMCALSATAAMKLKLVQEQPVTEKDDFFSSSKNISLLSTCTNITLSDLHCSFCDKRHAEQNVGFH